MCVLGNGIVGDVAQTICEGVVYVHCTSSCIPTNVQNLGI